MSAVVFEQPPSGSTRRSHFTDTVAKLRARPGEWARIATRSTARSSASMAHHIRSGRTGTWQPTGAFEAQARTVDGAHLVYARYIGKAS